MEDTTGLNLKDIKTITRFMVKELLSEKPSKPIPYLIEWVGKNWGLAGYENNAIREELKSLRYEKKKLLKMINYVDEDVSNCSSKSVSEDENVFINDLRESKINLNNLKNRRHGISAESYGLYNDINEYRPDFVKKSYETIRFLIDNLKKVVSLSNFGNKKLNVLANLMEKRELKLLYKKARRGVVRFR